MWCNFLHSRKLENGVKVWLVSAPFLLLVCQEPSSRLSGKLVSIQNQSVGGNCILVGSKVFISLERPPVFRDRFLLASQRVSQDRFYCNCRRTRHTFWHNRLQVVSWLTTVVFGSGNILFVLLFTLNKGQILVVMSNSTDVRMIKRIWKWSGNVNARYVGISWHRQCRIVKRGGYKGSYDIC